MITDLLTSLDEDNSYLYEDGTLLFHEEELYNAFNCQSLEEVRRIGEELVEEGHLFKIRQYIVENGVAIGAKEHNFYRTTRKVTQTILDIDHILLSQDHLYV